jgi:cell volume regulation protein A
LGYWTNIGQLASREAWLISGGALVVIYTSRWLILTVLRQQAAVQLLWIAPRGLITVLLFLSATDSGKLQGFPLGAVMLTVLVTSALTAIAHRQKPEIAAAPAGADPPPAAAELRSARIGPACNSHSARNHPNGQWRPRASRADDP